MRSSRFLAFGDWHAESGKEYGVLPGDRLKDQEAALDRVVDLAIELGVDAVLNAGDTFHGPVVTPAGYAAFQRPMRRLKEAGITCIAITGNGVHDNALRDVTAPAVVSDVCEVYGEPGIRIVGDTYVCLLPWAPISRLVAEADGGSRAKHFQTAAELLIKVARGMRAEVPEGAPCVLVTHFSISGASLPNGLPVDQLREIILPLADLEGLGFDAIVAGHIHKSQFLGTLAPDDELMPVFYTGSLLPVDFGEQDGFHGTTLLTVGEGYAKTKPIEIPSRPFVTLTADYADGEVADDLTMLLEGYGDWSHLTDAVVKFKYRIEQGDRAPDHAKLTQAALDAGASKVYSIVADVVRSSRARMAGVDETLAPLEALHAWGIANDLPDAMKQRVEELTASYLDRLAEQASTVSGGLNPIRVRATNYRTYADLDYTLPHGFVAFTGDNGAGKSSTINLVDVCLFAGRGELGDLIRTGEDSMEVSLEFESAGERYRVRRSVKRGKSQTVDLEILESAIPHGDVWSPISLENADATNRRILELIGLSRATFRASVFLRQRDRTSFTDCGAADRKRTLIEIIGLDEWEQLLALAKSDMASAEQQIAKLKTAVAIHEPVLAEKATVAGLLTLNQGLREGSAVAVAETEQLLESAQSALAANATAAEKVRTAQAELDAARKDEESLRVQVFEAKVAGQSQERCKTGIAEATVLADRVPELEARVSEMASMKARADAAIAERSALEASAVTLAAELERRQRENVVRDEKARALAAKQSALADGDVAGQICDRCEQHLHAEARERALHSYASEIGVLQAEIGAEVEELGDLARRALTVRDEAAQVSVTEVVDPAPVEAELAKARTAVTAIATLTEQLRVHTEKAVALPRHENDLEESSALVAILVAKVERACADVGDIDVLELAVTAARTQVTIARENAEKVTGEIARLTAAMERIEAAEHALSTIAVEISTVQTSLDLLAVACKAYGRDGVPALIVENSAIPQMEEEANGILQSFDTAYSIELRTQREQKNDTVAETLDIIVHDGVGERPLETYSEGEKSVIALACRLGLAKLLRAYGGKCTVLMADEVEFLSQARSLRMVEVLRGMEDLYDSILIVTHNPVVSGSCDAEVLFVKENDTSRIAVQPASEVVEEARVAA